MAEIYHTFDMENAVRALLATNPHVIIYHHYANLRRIVIRSNLLWDIEQYRCRAWDSFGPLTIEKWRENGGLMVYHPTLFDKNCPFPETDAVLFIECPLSHRDFQELAAKVKREIVIFHPPSWRLHEETVEFRNPHSAYYHTLLSTIGSLVRRPDLKPRIEAAMRYANFDPDRTAGFEAADIYAITGIPPRQLRTLMKWKGFRGKHIRYHCYCPVVEPDEPDLLEMYRVLEAEPDAYHGIRMLRFNELARVLEHGIGARVMGFKRLLKRMVNEGYVRSDPDIYLLTEGWKQPDYAIVDAITNVRRAEFYRMKTLVEDSPEYGSY